MVPLIDLVGDGGSFLSRVVRIGCPQIARTRSKVASDCDKRV